MASGEEEFEDSLLLIPNHEDRVHPVNIFTGCFCCTSHTLIVSSFPSLSDIFETSGSECGPRSHRDDLVGRRSRGRWNREGGWKVHPTYKKRRYGSICFL